MTIKSEGVDDTESFHNGEARAIDKAEQVIRIIPKDLQRLLKISYRNILQDGGLLSQDRRRNPHRQSMAARCFIAHSYQSRSFRQDIVRHDQGFAVSPEPSHSGFMVWIIPHSHGKPRACINESRIFPVQEGVVFSSRESFL